MVINDLKKCTKCEIKKPLSEFHKNKSRKDGVCIYCKTCKNELGQLYRKEYMKDFVKRRKMNDAAIKYRDRNIEKILKRQITSAQISAFNKKARNKNPEKLKGQNAISGFKKEKGYHFHHWSYNAGDLKDVIKLKIKDHYIIHRYLKYDPISFKYIRADTLELLKTKEEHLNFINSLINK